MGLSGVNWLKRKIVLSEFSLKGLMSYIGFPIFNNALAILGLNIDLYLSISHSPFNYSLIQQF